MILHSKQFWLQRRCSQLNLSPLMVLSVIAAVLVGGLPAAAADLPPGITAAALAPRSVRTGETMFTAMSASTTGIVTENKYADPRMWAELYQEITFGAIGTGVTVGDYDNDGRPDVFIVSKTEKSRLFRNLGDWKFEDVTDKAGIVEPNNGAGANAKPGEVPWKQGTTFVDVNNDGALDLYVCRFNAPNLLFINQGNGTFKEEAAARGLAVVDACGMAAFCDYDRDGWLDVYVQTNMLSAHEHPNGQRDYLFHNNGDGTFTNVTDRAGIGGETSGHSATWWDYDQDGWPDLYVANDYAVPDVLYHNNHDGTFTNTAKMVLPHTPYYAMGSDLGDVNNDGLIDLLVADMAPSNHQKDQRGMAVSRSLNLDGKDDPRGAPQSMQSALYLNTGRNVMMEAATLAGVAATDWTWSVRFEDLDNDGRLDLHVTNGMNREYHNVDILQRIMGGENVDEQRRLMRSSPVLSETNFAFRNLGGLRFENVSATWGLDQRGVSFGAAFGDFDGDGDLDLIFANYQGGATVLRNDSPAGHRVLVELRGTTSNRFGVGATVRVETPAAVQVRQLVLARGYLSSSEPLLHFGLGDETRISRLTVTWPSGKTQVFENLPVDQRFTITEAGGASRVEVGGGRSLAPGQFEDAGQSSRLATVVGEDPGATIKSTSLVPMRLDRRGPAIAVADLDGDGRDDVVYGGTTKDRARLFVAATEKTFSEMPLPASETAVLDDGPIVAFDANGDGRDDLLITRSGVGSPAGSKAYQPALFINQGGAAFAAAPAGTLPSLALSAGAVAVADVDRDGMLDVFVGARVLPGKYPLPPKSALLLNRGGKFEDVTDSLAPGLKQIGLVTSAVWSDVDGDGWVDLLIALEWGGVRYWHNDGGERFEDWSAKAGFAAAGTGWWTSIATADFNGDGRPDYVVGNQGLNTPYQGTKDNPALLLYGAFGGSGVPQLVEAYFEGDRLYPRRTRNELGAAIPSVLKRFPKNDAYARATLGEILGEPALASAHRFEATELRSGVFLSQLDGTYTFAPLPRLAQIAPLQGIVAGDFDGDGFADIYAVQNFFSSDPALGRFDGGVSQLLRGDGSGGFAAVPANESGLVVRGDAKALAVIDLDGDGWPDFVGTRNDDKTFAFRNRGVAGRHMFSVRLQGTGGNPRGIGARLTLHLADGSKQTAEIVAGSGYFSQSSAGVFFGYRDAAEPRTVSIRWPDGTTTEHPVPAGVTTLLVKQP